MENFAGFTIEHQLTSPAYSMPQSKITREDDTYTKPILSSLLVTKTIYSYSI